MSDVDRRPGADELARRTPPGQVLTTKWPVLTFGLTPRFDPTRWSFRCFGLVERDVSWSWPELLALPRVEVTCDIHCVTRWSRLDNRFEGVPIREIMARVRPRPEARYVLGHDRAGHAEFALAIADDFQGLGLGRALLQRLAAHAAANGVGVLFGHVLEDNAPMLALMRRLGATLVPSDGGVRAALML